MGSTRTINKRDEAVSEIISVILLVAIAVILAAVIGVFVMGFGSSVHATKVVGVTATYPSSSLGEVTFVNGKGLDRIKSWNVMIDGSEVSSQSSAPSCGQTYSFSLPSSWSLLTIAATFDDGTKQVLLQQTHGSGSTGSSSSDSSGSSGSSGGLTATQVELVYTGPLSPATFTVKNSLTLETVATGETPYTLSGLPDGTYDVMYEGSTHLVTLCTFSFTMPGAGGTSVTC